jgi:hypothetical protein
MSLENNVTLEARHEYLHCSTHSQDGSQFLHICIFLQLPDEAGGNAKSDNHTTLLFE